MGYFSAQQAEQAEENRQDDTGECEYYCYVEEMKAMRIDEEYPQYLVALELGDEHGKFR